MRNSLLTPWLLVPVYLGIPDAIAAQNATTTNSSAPDTVVGWYTGSSERSTLSLVYSCLITTFACTWTVLHLNVPKLGESSWTRFIRKAKWMAITVLLPEFIFSKAVCELRLALKYLHAFDKKLQKDYTGGLGCRSSVRNSAGEQLELSRQWRVRYSAFVLLLFPLLGLPRPDTQSCIRDNADVMEHLGRVRVDEEAVSEGSSNESMAHNSRTPSQQSPDKGKTSTDREQEAEQRACSLDLVIGTTLTSRHEAHGPTISVPNPKRPHSSPSKGDGNLETYEQGRRCQSLPNVHREYAHSPQSRTVFEIGGDTQIETSSLRRFVSSSEVQPSRTIHEWQDWTLAHSYLANMGGIIHGFSNSWDQIEYTVLTGNKLCHLSWKKEEHPLEQLVLTQEDIIDRSKADWFLRALAILQISWLVLTIIARRASTLPLTQLELATSAFSVFAVATYAVNWWKPKDISQPIRLNQVGNGYANPSEPTKSIMLHLLSPGRVRNKASEIIGTSRVGNDVVELEGRIPLVFQLMAAAAFVFGGIHCLAWNFVFPSQTESILWRTASIASAIIPILPLAVSIVSNHIITIAEDIALSFLESELDWLNKYPSNYLDLIVEPSFMHWDASNFATLLREPAGMRDFLHKPNQEESEEASLARHIFDSAATRIRPIFLDTRRILIWWRKRQEGKTNGRFLIDQAFRSHYTWNDAWNRAKDFLIDYENSFVRTAVPLSEEASSDRTLFQLIMEDTRTAFMDEQQKVGRTKDICEMISIWSMLICGTFYISARLMIIVLLFTSLREVPLGVYKETHWTRFLPNFS